VIATLPFNFDSNIILANSVDEVIQGRTTVLFTNVETLDIAIRRGQQIASFEELASGAELRAQSAVMSALVSVGDSQEVVKVGDNLTASQVKELRKLLDSHQESFSVVRRWVKLICNSIKSSC